MDYRPGLGREVTMREVGQRLCRADLGWTLPDEPDRGSDTEWGSQPPRLSSDAPRAGHGRVRTHEAVNRFLRLRWTVRTRSTRPGAGALPHPHCLGPAEATRATPERSVRRHLLPSSSELGD
jgi:hypothetical protein